MCLWERDVDAWAVGRRDCVADGGAQGAMSGGGGREGEGSSRPQTALSRI